MQNQFRNFAIVALIAALAVVTCWKQSPGQGEAKTTNWKYMIVAANDDELNQFAAKGWEVCGAFSHTVAGSTATVGRAIIRHPKE